LLCSSCDIKQQKNENPSTNIFYEKAFNFRESKKTDSAFKYFNKAKDVFLVNRDSLGVAKCFANMAYISNLNNDYFGGQDLSLQALKYFNTKIDSQYVQIKTNYNILGEATYQLKDYANAIKFYDFAIKFSKNPVHTSMYLNNKAKVYQEIREFGKALKIFQQALKGLNQNSKEYAMTITNIALTKWLQDINYNAVPSYIIALHIREKENDLLGQNSSHIHLAEYYIKNRPDSALFYAKKAYQISKKINSANDQLYALQLLINLSEPAITKRYFENYKLLDDSVKQANNTNKNQFALIRYESEKSKADNLVLQQEKIEREIMLFGAALLILIGSVAGIFWYKKRKQKLELQAQNAIQESRLKTSKKVHDVVANGLYRVMTEIENQDVVDKENVLDKIEVLYEKSRDISYEETTSHEEEFHEKIADLIKSFATENTKILLVGNTADLWLQVNAIAKFEIEHVLQELMVNMKKHSQANNVVFRFEQEEELINIYYIDNGIGMPKGLNFKNGLTNTGNRIESINGTITFDHKVEKGLRIQISFPLA
jgi:tetratricopeptide (TPR) repeat protein